MNREPRFHGKVSEKSHKNMSRIRGKDTSIEIKLREALYAKGYRFRKNYKEVPGTPDIALTKYRIAIFCDGEYKETKGPAGNKWWLLGKQDRKKHFQR